jgi:hypothetical protein
MMRSENGWLMVVITLSITVSQDIQKHVPEEGRDDLRETIEAIQESLRKSHSHS